MPLPGCEPAYNAFALSGEYREALERQFQEPHEGKISVAVAVAAAAGGGVDRTARVGVVLNEVPLFRCIGLGSLFLHLG